MLGVGSAPPEAPLSGAPDCGVSTCAGEASGGVWAPYLYSIWVEDRNVAWLIITTFVSPVQWMNSADKS